MGKDKILFSAELCPANVYRRDYLLQKFNKWLNLSSSDLLEIGIGNGRFGKLLANYFNRYYGIDPDLEYVGLARENIPTGAKVFYEVGSAENIPFERDFDIVFYGLSWHVIKHKKALQETMRVLSKNGLVSILEPSIHTKNWASHVLKQGHPKFDERLYKRKISQLRKAEEYLKNQDVLKIVEHEYDPETTLNIWILKPK